MTKKIELRVNEVTPNAVVLTYNGKNADLFPDIKARLISSLSPITVGAIELYCLDSKDVAKAIFKETKQADKKELDQQDLFESAVRVVADLFRPALDTTSDLLMISEIAKVLTREDLNNIDSDESKRMRRAIKIVLSPEFAKNANKDLCKSLKVTTNFLDVLEAALKLSKKYSIINHE